MFFKKFLKKLFSKLKLCIIIDTVTFIILLFAIFFNSTNKGECSRTNAAILVCLDYCAEKLEMQKTLKNLNAEIERLTMLNEVAEKEKAALEREIEVLKAMSAPSPKATVKKANEDQICLDEIPEIESPVAEAAEVAEPEAVVEESLTPPTEEAVEEKPTVKLKKKKVRAMFDMISFDDI